MLQMMPLPVGSLAGVLGIFSVSQAAEPTSGDAGDIHWSVSGTTLTLTSNGGSGKMNNYSGWDSNSSDASNGIVHQSYYDMDGKPYSGSSAPWGCYANRITEVKMSGVKRLGNHAFYAFERLKNIFNSDSVEEFGDHVFHKCSNLTTISLKADAKMGKYVFAGTGLPQVIWPTSGEDSTMISNGAFQGCESIGTIEIPATVTKLGEKAFDHCTTATSIEGLDNVTEFGESVFSNCNKLTDVKWSNQVHTIKKSAFRGCEGLKSITIPEYITEIEALAFNSCGNGRDGMNASGVKVTIPDSVESIGTSAFGDCSKIKEVVIGKGVKSIGSSAFYNCSKLDRLEWKTTILESIGDHAFWNTGFTAFTVPASVTDIGVNPFIGGNLKVIEVESGNAKYTVENKMLVTKDAPKKVISYPRYAGSNAVVPNTVKEIGESAFMNAYVSTVELPKGLTSMGRGAFAGSSLTTVTLPKSLESISPYAFSETSSLRSVEFQQGLKKIGSYAFRFATELTSVSFPGSLETIDQNAFYYASALTSVNGEGGRLTTVGKNAFEHCEKLKDVRFGGDLEELGDDAFQSCYSISEITLPDKLHTIGTGVFKGCTSLKRIVFPNSIKSVGSSALSGCTSLESVDFGSIIQKITGDVFDGCPNLAKITISKNNPNMTAENNVLYDKEKKKLIYYAAALPDDKFYVPEGVTTIGSYAFNYCSKLEELRFRESVTTMEDDAVCNNTSIDKIFFYGNAPKVSSKSKSETKKVVNGKEVTTYYYGNAAINKNRVGSSFNNKGLFIFVLKDSEGWEKGWTGFSDNKTDTETSKYIWDEKYELDSDRWDPNRTDVSHGTFEGTELEWVYTDEIGEVKFIGKGASPDFETNLFSWLYENAELWLDSIGEPKDYS